MGAPTNSASQTVKAVNINVAQRRRDALELRKANATYQQIADALGYSSAKAASKDIRKAIKSMPEDGMNDLRRVQKEQYGHMAMKLWNRAVGGDLAAMDRWIKIQKEIALLYGLDAAVKLDVKSEATVTHDGTGGVLFIGGETAEYIASLKKVVGVDSGIEPGAGPGPDDDGSGAGD